eukprot:403368484
MSSSDYKTVFPQLEHLDNYFNNNSYLNIPDPFNYKIDLTESHENTPTNANKVKNDQSLTMIEFPDNMKESSDSSNQQQDDKENFIEIDQFLEVDQTKTSKFSHLQTNITSSSLYLFDFKQQVEAISQNIHERNIPNDMISQKTDSLISNNNLFAQQSNITKNLSKFYNSLNELNESQTESSYNSQKFTSSLKSEEQASLEELVSKNEIQNNNCENYYTSFKPDQQFISSEELSNQKISCSVLQPESIQTEDKSSPTSVRSQDKTKQIKKIQVSVTSQRETKYHRKCKQQNKIEKIKVGNQQSDLKNKETQILERTVVEVVLENKQETDFIKGIPIQAQQSLLKQNQETQKYQSERENQLQKELSEDQAKINRIQRRGRTTLKIQDFIMEKTRCDVVFKTILRQMRKTLRKEFIKSLGIVSKKQSLKVEQDFGIYLEKFMEQFKDIEENFKEPFRFFLGAFLYPKHMKSLILSNKQSNDIDEIHKCLYSFSICKLEFLNTFPAYPYLLKYFISKYQEKIMSSNQAIRKAQNDFQKGFDYLAQFYTNI